MHSSISNSELPRASLKSIAVLLAALAAGQAVLQVASVWLLSNYGNLELLWADERQDTESLKHDGKGVLLIGSSVLLGVDTFDLQWKLPEWTIRRLVMAGTSYTDWEYSLRRLFREGIKPDYVILTPMPFQLYGDADRGDYLPLHWLDSRDIPDLARKKKLGLTATSNLFFAAYNSFFALRDDIRKALLNKILPGHSVLLAAPADKRVYSDDEAKHIMGDRLAALQTLLTANGAKLVVLQYPAPKMEKPNILLKTAAATRNIPCISAVDSMPESAFRDAYHLSSEGGADFVRALVPVLGRELNRLKR